MHCFNVFNIKQFLPGNRALQKKKLLLLTVYRTIQASRNMHTDRNISYLEQQNEGKARYEKCNLSEFPITTAALLLRIPKFEFSETAEK